MQKKRKRSRLKDSVVNFMIIAVVTIGWYIMMFPTAADLVNRIFNQNTIVSYNHSMVTYSDDELEKMFQDCKDYNQTIYEEQQTSEFRYRGPMATGEDYMKVPTSGHTIGTIRIPAIDVNLQIVHGTSDNDLQSSAGHLYGTSLPIEGQNVHAVIAAHSALSTAKLFTDLTKVNKGDQFYITILNKELEYTIDEINVVLPEDDYMYEQIVPGKNYVTLYTCTPYGVNTHRLMVRGALTKVETRDLSNEGGFSIKEVWPIITNSAKLAGVTLLPFVIMLGYAWYERHERIKKLKAKGLWVPRKKRKAKRKKQRRKEDFSYYEPFEEETEKH